MFIENASQAPLTLMSSIYIITGTYHFLKPKFFLRITPKWVPVPHIVNKVVGAVEIMLGLALHSNYRQFAAIGIIALLIIVFPANINHYLLSRKKGKHIIPTLIRLPLQLLLIYWAYTFI